MFSEKLPKNKLLILGGFTLFLVILLLVYFFQQQKTSKVSQLTPEEMLEEFTEETALPVLPPVMPAPQMSFDTYQTTVQAPVVPESVRIINFKSNYPPAYAITLGKKLGFSSSKTESKTMMVYNLTDEENRGYLKFDLTNGSFNFLSYGTHTSPAGENSTVNEQARTFLANLGVIDDTVTCPITYQRREIAGITFVECHRSWEKVGMPIISFLGLLNVPENQALSQIKVGIVDENALDDSSIYNTSTGQDGKKRPDDFNTATVAVNDEGDILSISSNIRQIESRQEVNSDMLLTYEEAWEKLKNGNTQLSFITPLDPANADWDDAFPDNQAANLEGTVTDVMLTYLEHQSRSNMLEPMYVVRGKVQLPSGYAAKFIQAVSASKNKLSYLEDKYLDQGQVAAATAIPTAPYDESLKLGTFNPEQRALQETPPSICVPSESQLNPIISLANLGDVGPFTVNTQGAERVGNWFLIPLSRETLPTIDQVIGEFDKLGLQGDKAELRELKKLQKEWQKYSFCPLRLTGSSPTVFVYGEEGDQLNIKVDHDLTFTTPSTADDNGWEVTIGENKQLEVEENLYDYIYYEYDPIEFTAPNAGWLVKKADLEEFAKGELSTRMRLNDMEKDRLYFELSLAAENVDSDYLKISPINNMELNNKLPLTVSPMMSVQRYHFLVNDAQADDRMIRPVVSPVSRFQPMVLELGATIGPIIAE